MSAYLILIIALLNFPDTSSGKINNTIPFTSLSFSTVSKATSHSKVTDFNWNIISDKVLLNWKAQANETVSMFEVERSNDGKSYTIAALVFGTDESLNNKYQFFEKIRKTRMFYRIKLIDKNQQESYSETVTVEPGR